MSEPADTLRSLPSAQWRPLEPGDPDELARLEEEFSVRLPGDYRDLMVYSDGGSLSGPKTEINLEPVSGLFAQNYDDRFTENLPGMFVIGDDGSGGVYFYDPKGRLGHGEYGLYSVKLGLITDMKYVVFVAPGLTEAVRRVLDGAQFRWKPNKP